MLVKLSPVSLSLTRMTRSMNKASRISLDLTILTTVGGDIWLSKNKVYCIIMNKTGYSLLWPSPLIFIGPLNVYVGISRVTVKTKAMYLWVIGLGYRFLFQIAYRSSFKQAIAKQVDFKQAVAKQDAFKKAVYDHQISGQLSRMLSILHKILSGAIYCFKNQTFSTKKWMF